MAGLPDFPEVRIRAERLDIREFSPADASLVREVLQCGEWLPLSTALVETTEYPADVDWWLAEAIHEPRRDRTGLNLMMLAREADRIVGWICRWALTTGGLQRTWLRVNTDNLASLRVAQKAAFTLEGTLRRASLEEDGLHDVAILALLDDEI